MNDDTSTSVTALRARSSAKSWLTRAGKTLCELMTKLDVSETELQLAIDQFENRMAKLDICQQQVEELISDDNLLEAEIDKAADFRDEKLKALIRAKEQIFLLKNNTNNTGEIQSPVSWTSRSPMGLPSPAKTEARLPKLQLPTFNGEVTQWQSFWDQFEAIIDKSQQSDINKFSYLRSLLTDEALASIRGLALTSENYETAKTILQQRFGRKERIIFGHLQEMLSANKTFTQDSMWTLYDKIQTHVRSLETLGIGGERYGVILTPLILHQLPTNIRLEWARMGEGREGDLDFLLKFLFEEIRRRERSQTFDVASLKADKPKVPRKQSTAASLVTQDTNRQRKTCAFCQGDHFSDKCQEISGLNFEARKDKIKRKGLCFRCLGKHLANTCRKTCYFCRGKHHCVLCKNKNPGQIKSDRSTNSETVGIAVGEDTTSSANVGVSYSQSGNKTTIMQVVSTRIGSREVNVMFDSGSDRSFINSSCAKKLDLEVKGEEYLNYACFGEKEQVRDGQSKKVFGLNVGNQNIRLIEMEVICSTMYRAPVPEEILEYFNDVKFGEDFRHGRSVKIDILIGLDHFWHLIKPEKMKTAAGLVAQNTVFGWMLSGVWMSRGSQRVGKNECRKQFSMFCQSEISDREVRRFWDLDTIGIDTKSELEKPIDKCFETFNEEIKFDGERYVVNLPWKNEHCKDTLMNNREIAQKRLNSLNKRFNGDPDLKSQYDSVLSDWEKEGIIKESVTEEIETKNPTFYLPHRPVIRTESLTTKVRPVFDASCKGENGISLNDCMQTGPNLIPDLAQILLRFRRWRFGLSADITKAFLQIKVNKRDQDVHRFLWDVNNQTRTMKFDRVIFGNSSSPFLLNATVKFHLSKYDTSNCIEELKNNLYVDDWLTGADKEEEVVNMMKEAEMVLREGGFPLTKWASSCSAVKDELSKTFDGYKDIENLKVLGISWLTDEDSFIFRGLDLSDFGLCTKRLLLSLAARIFDPLGLLTPFSITVKLLFQETWRQGYDWDDILPAEFQTSIQKWTSEMKEIQNWKIPRRISDQAWNDAGKKELVVFADASERAYGCCVYLVTYTDESRTSSLVISRVRVAPLKRVTLPRLELLAALIAARLLDYVRSALGLDSEIPYTCYSDSQIVLSWIKSDANRWKQFVTNRVVEIQRLTSPANWRHCPGKENPADLLTRGLPSRQLMDSPLWLRGPEWLRCTSRISQEEIEDENENTDFEALQTSELELEDHGNVVLSAVDSVCCPLLDYSRFSTFGRLIRVVAWVLRFMKNLKNPKGRKFGQVLSSEELSCAKNSLFLCLQRQFYKDELQDLMQGRVVKKTSPIYQLSPFIGNDGLMRVHSRLEFAPSLLYDEKYPILLPKCHVTFLLIRAQHILMKHTGVNTLITTLRNKFWIVSVRVLAKRVCKNCLDCQKQDARSCDQVTAPLPEDRIKQAPPFSVIGVDHAGPLFCSDKEHKLYILLLTCAVTRAVHIELVDSLSLDDFLYAFKRFSARRGLPKMIYSDNAKTFKAANHFLQNQMSHIDITWKFSAPLAPWWGGWWERLIRSIKSSLRKTLGKELVTRVQLETTLQEIEACINSRPLTYVYESGFPITPSHFLIGRSSPMLNVGSEEFDGEMNNLELRERCQIQGVDQFWQHWRNEYIRSLPPMKPKKPGTDLKVGSVVLIREENKPRLQWPMGVITKVFPGRDGLIRAVEIKTSKGVLCRAVQKLHKLELFDQAVCDNSISGHTDTDEPVTNDTEESGPNDTVLPNGTSKAFSSKGRPLKPRKMFDM